MRVRYIKGLPIIRFTLDRLKLLDLELRNNLKNFTEKIIFHSSLPLDLRSNAGIIFVSTLAIEDMKTILTQGSEDDETTGARLSLAHGILSCCTLPNLSGKTEDQPESSLLHILLKLYLRIASSVQVTSAGNNVL